MRYFLALALMICILVCGLPLLLATSRNSGEEFYENTKIKSGGVRLKNPFRSLPPVPAKTYPRAEKITLPAPNAKGLLLEEALKQRRTSSGFGSRPLSLESLSQLLFAAQGITGNHDGLPLRTAPSAGGLYPLEMYLVAVNVTDLKPGIYHYLVHEGKLEGIMEGDFHEELQRIAVGQPHVGQAAATFIITSIWDRVTVKYRERGHRYAYIEAGCISQNIALQAASLDLASNCIGAFYDDDLNNLLGIDGTKESVIFLHCVGKK